MKTLEPTPQKNMRLILVSGRSGSGKSTCLHVLEDLGFYCIDNLPIELLPSLVKQIGPIYPLVAIGIDARNMVTDLTKFDKIVHSLSPKVLGEKSNDQTVKNYELEILYVDADDQTLLKRFSETRRKHPLTNKNTSLQEALEKEREILDPINERADNRIDTSRLNHHQLRDLLYKTLDKTSPKTLSILFQSFGYKYGVPPDTDYVFDVRCLPNPYWEPHLRPRTGLDPAIEKYLSSHKITQDLLSDMTLFLSKWIPCFAVDNRNYLTIAVGCTGGHHRSVFVCEHLTNHFRESCFQQFNTNIQVRHRELI